MRTSLVCEGHRLASGGEREGFMIEVVGIERLRVHLDSGLAHAVGIAGQGHS